MFDNQKIVIRKSGEISITSLFDREFCKSNLIGFLLLKLYKSNLQETPIKVLLLPR